MYMVGACFERKNSQYKIVAAVAHESKGGTQVYLVAVRTFGESDVTYMQVEGDYFRGYELSTWLG